MSAGLIGELVGAVPEAGVVGIDMPMGLPDGSTRDGERLVRRVLGRRHTSLFTTLVRSAYDAPDLGTARERQVAATGRSFSLQSWGLRPKVLELDAYRRSGPVARLVEVHPETSFTAMAGAPLATRKRSEEGRAERRTLLGDAGMDVPAYTPGRGYAEDDLLDACAAAWSADRVARDVATSYPERPEVFSDGIPAAIFV